MSTNQFVDSLNAYSLQVNKLMLTHVNIISRGIWGFSPRSGDTLHRWSEINFPTTNFTPTRIYNAHISTL